MRRTIACFPSSFANTSSSLLIAKVQGNIVDLLMPPLSAGEMVLAFALGGVTRGILVAFAEWVRRLGTTGSGPASFGHA